MVDPYNLQRFVDAQDGILPTVLAELRAGSKQSHWMWFVFPQLRSLGRSPTAQYYGIGCLDEARAYRNHALLGSRLNQCVDIVLPWAGRRTAEQIFGSIDATKLRSCLTLFDRIEPGSSFEAAIIAFFDGVRDDRTLALLNAPQ